jgi:phage/plasmid-like protein (TIGR03299 family)
MSHGFIENGDTGFFVGQKPWHSFGTVIQEAPTVEDGIRLAGLDWDVITEPLVGKVTGLEVDNKAILRTDNFNILGVVGSQYTPLQNIEAFNWFNPFIESGFVELETAGCLFGGKKLFILAKIKMDEFEIQDNDPVESYILLSNSHDGTTAVRVGYTPIRVVCNNTLKLATENKQSQLIRVRHTYQVQNNLTTIGETMDIVNKQFITTAEQYKWLANRDIVKSDLEKYVKQVFSTKSLESLLEDEEVDNKGTKILAYVENRMDIEDKHNWWTAYNSVQHYMQHGSERATLENSYGRLWFGNNDTKNKKALELALQLAA